NGDANEIIMGLGGSGTNDGGFGMARAWGFRFLAHEHELRGAVTELAGLERIQMPKDLILPKIIAAVDVKNPLLGKNGATRVFGPQKGVTKDQIDKLERTLTRLADDVAEELGFDYRDKPGADADRRLGYGLASFGG